MDNTTILFNALTRTYRNAMVVHIRKCMTAQFGEKATEQLQLAFGKEQWEELRLHAEQSRQEGTGRLSQKIADDFELLGVERFFNVFEKHFDVLCARHASKPKKEKSQAKQVLSTWLKHVKDVRDPISHSITEDIDYDDAVNALYCARKALDFVELPDAAEKVLEAQSLLLGGVNGADDLILSVMPPADEVVVHFVGRHAELDFLQNWFRNRDSKRFALSGEGGKGKSAIAYAFARSIATRKDHGMEAVIWMSAKQRRFIEGRTVLVNRPDFHNKKTAIAKILEAYGSEVSADDHSGNEASAISLLREFPALIVADDIDTVESDGEDAIEFLMMTVPELTPSRVLFTSRRALFGMQSFTKQVPGLNDFDGQKFLQTRCSLMGIAYDSIAGNEKTILEVTDASPLFMEDLLRLTQAGLGIKQAIGVWKERRGNDAREYAIKREYESLSPDAQQVLLAVALEGPCENEDICRGLSWSVTRLLDALQQLQKMFLMPIQSVSSGRTKLALNGNMQLLVLDVFSGTDALDRTRRLMQAAAGELVTRRGEDASIGSLMRRVGLLTKQHRFLEAEAEISSLMNQFPGRCELHAALGYVYKRLNRTVEAVEQFSRAHELGKAKRETYWHWSEIEADRDEWTESERVSRLGLSLYSTDAGLLYRRGYALQRLGRDNLQTGKVAEGKKQLEDSQAILEKALSFCEADQTNRMLRSNILRALVLNAEGREDIGSIVKYFAQWHALAPDDYRFKTEKARLAVRYAILAER